MNGIIPVIDTLIGDAKANRPGAFCVVVATRGSAPQSAGAALAIRSDSTTVGTLGGGCVEAEVCKRAFEMLRARESGLLDFVLDHDYGWDDGLICGGRMTIAVMPVTRQAGLPDFEAALETARRHELATVAVRVDHESQPLEYRVLIEASPTLLIAGAGHVGQALARLAVDLDFRVKVIDDRADFASRERFDPRVELIVDDIARTLRNEPLDAGSFVVIVTRGHQHDHQALDAVVRRPAAYLGMIGSKRKSRMILKDLAESGVSAVDIERVHTPIGLPINAVTVNEIAVSIAAELVQVRRQSVGKIVEGPFDAQGRCVSPPRAKES